MRRIYWIVITLSVLSITLTIILIIKSIELKKWTGDIPVEEFYDMDYSDQSYHINDFRNYGYGATTYDKEKGLLVREVVEGDFYFVPESNFDGKEPKAVLIMNLFNYGENYSILKKVKDDCTIPLAKCFISEFRICLLDKSSVFLKKKLYNKKYGDAGLTDIALDTYIPETNKTERIVHNDVFVTPLALKYLQDAGSTGCLVFLQLLNPGPNAYSPDVVVREVVAVGDYTNTYILKDHSDMIYSKHEIDEEFIQEYVKELLKN